MSSSVEVFLPDVAGLLAGFSFSHGKTMRSVGESRWRLCGCNMQRQDVLTCSHEVRSRLSRLAFHALATC